MNSLDEAGVGTRDQPAQALWRVGVGVGTWGGGEESWEEV